MNRHNLLFAIAVACGAASLGALAQQPAVQPSRVAIAMSADERESVLERMRAMLAHTRTILDAALRDDRAQVTTSARALGLHGGAHMPPELAPRLPAAFKQLARETHRAFDEIADEAGSGGSRDAILRRLADNLGRCVTCHAGYRLAEVR